MDWGLLQRNSVNRYLRDKIVYPKGVCTLCFVVHVSLSLQFYYFAIVNNMVCRCMFTVNMSVGWLGIWFTDGLTLVLALVEIYRYDVAHILLDEADALQCLQ